ncbi:MAG: RNA methyltransferase [Candidatus Cloacimonetes bacterium]|nr:RNA methyltransferase [Candidatus Cloacimonadota bacterium]
MNSLYLGLVHYPVVNKQKEIVTTSITNLDIHDISRSCRTFGVEEFFIINPLPTQKELLLRILKFWQGEIGVKYNPLRAEALRLVAYAQDIRSVTEMINKQEGVDPIIVTTSAASHPNSVGYNEIRKVKEPVLLLLGTGNGLAQIIHDSADYILEAIAGIDNYNHLSVRSAAAIVLERLTSEK